MNDVGCSSSLHQRRHLGTETCRTSGNARGSAWAAGSRRQPSVFEVDLSIGTVGHGIEHQETRQTQDGRVVPGSAVDDYGGDQAPVGAECLMVGDRGWI